MSYKEELKNQREEVAGVLKRKKGYEAIKDLLLVKDEVFRFRMYLDYTWMFEDETGTKLINIIFNEEDTISLGISTYMTVEEILEGGAILNKDQQLLPKHIEIVITDKHDQR